MEIRYLGHSAVELVEGDVRVLVDPFLTGNPKAAVSADEQVDAAIEALTQPGRLEEAQRLVGAHAPQLHRILDQALAEADWFGSAHQAEVLKAAGTADVDERLAAVQTLIAEETRVSMLIGVAVGYELAHALVQQTTEE